MIIKSRFQTRIPRKKLFRYLGLGIFLAVTFALLWQGNVMLEYFQDNRSAAAGNAPNVVVFMIDDLEVDLLKQMTDSGKMPHFKSEFVDKGTSFLNAFVNRSVCCTSRATFLTGKYAHNHGVWNVDGAETQSPDRFAAYLAETSNAYLPTWLKAKNYRNIFVGKWHLGYKSSPHPDINAGDGIEVSGYDTRPGAYRAFTWGQSADRPLVYQTKYIGDMAKQKMQASVSPQFVYLAPNAVHTAVGVFTAPASDSLATIPNKNIVSMTQFRHYADGIWNQHIVTESNGVYEWWFRTGGSANRPSYSTSYAPIGNQVSSILDGRKVVGWNVYSTPTSNFQHVVLQSGTNYAFYSRSVSGGVATQWEFQGDTSVLTGTDVSLPFVDWAVLRYPDGAIRQQVLQGSPELGFKSFVRHRTAAGGFSAWIEDAYWGDIAGFYRPVGFSLSPYGPSTGVANAQYQIELVTLDTQGNPKSLVSAALPDFFQISATGNPTMLVDNNDNGRFEEEAGAYAASYMQHQMPHLSNSLSRVAGATASQTALHPYFLMRAPAEGSWYPIAAGQTYDWGGNYPAGSLRVNGRHHSSEYLPSFKPLSIAKPSYNKSLTGVLPNWYETSWPTLTQTIWAATSNEKILLRLTLDRMEQLMSIDKMVGEVVAHAKAVNPNTLFIFTSDNGHFNGEHRLGNKYTPHEESIKIPLYIRIPGQNTSRLVSHLVTNADLAPTILDYAGISWEDKVDGRSLKPLLESVNVPWRNALLIQHKRPFPDAVPSPSDWAYGLPAYNALRIMAGQLNELYVHYKDPKTSEYFERYNLITDPYQQQNIATGINQAYETAINAFSTCKHASCRTSDIVNLPTPTNMPSPLPTSCVGVNADCTAADVNNDGVISLADYQLIISNYSAYSLYIFNKLVQLLIN